LNHRWLILMRDEMTPLEEEYRKAVIKIASIMLELIDEMRKLRGTIDRMPRGRL